MSTHPHWIHHERGLSIRVGQLVDALPTDLEALLIGANSVELTADPAHDLVCMEGHLREEACRLLTALEDAEAAATAARESLGRAGLLQLRRARRRFTASCARQAELVERIEQVRDLQQQVREFVIGLDVPSGLLAEVTAGWRRSPAFPASVIVFDDEDSFLAVDPRRADMSRGYARIAGDLYGEQWRRDGDDDEPCRRPSDRIGPWCVGYIADTGEIYAARRSSYHLQQVWLLGRGFRPDEAHPLLTGLEPSMRQPNSLILVAGTVHASRSLRNGWTGSRCTLPDDRPAIRAAARQ